MNAIRQSGDSQSNSGATVSRRRRRRRRRRRKRRMKYQFKNVKNTLLVGGAEVLSDVTNILTTHLQHSSSTAPACKSENSGNQFLSARTLPSYV